LEQHRDVLPFSDQLPTFDPPRHTAHRALLMRLITPKRLKENEEFMWRLADRQIDEFLARSECEFIHDYASPFTLLVIADLLGVPEEDRPDLREELQGQFRLARVATTIGGVDVGPATNVFVMPGAANRDPRQFEAPDELRLDRPNGRQHIGFGFGLHLCAGAPLARAEAYVSTERLL